jgi:hypothetical protein
MSPIAGYSYPRTTTAQQSVRTRNGRWETANRCAPGADANACAFGDAVTLMRVERSDTREDGLPTR